MAFEASKKEWNELYAFLRILVDGKIYHGNIRMERDGNMVCPVSFIQRVEHDGIRNYYIEDEYIHICGEKLRKECNLLEMSIGQSLIIVIGYELVSYLLHYSSVRCVTFKELFVCKSNNKTGD